MKENYSYCNDSTVIMPGFYESLLFDSDKLYYENENNKSYCESCGEPYEELDIDDFQAYMDEVCKSITDNLIAPMLTEDSDICDKVEFDHVISPMYYNFTTDRIVMNLNIDLDALKEFILNNDHYRNGFDKYLEEHYTSRDGFCSFVANNIDDFFKENKYMDVLIDYYLLTKIYGYTNVVDMEREYTETSYVYDMIEIADEVFYNHLTAVETVE